MPIFNYQLQQNAILPLMARTFALNCLYNNSRDIFANPKGFEDQMVMRCCVTKTMMGWNLLKTASTCRERCGGQGYLAISRFSDYLACAHASVTAEGDNRVLMVKVVKDMLTNILKTKSMKLPQTSLNVVKQIGSFTDVT